MGEIIYLTKGSETCPKDESKLFTSRFDVAFRSPDEEEEDRLVLAVPAQLCKPCHELFIAPDLLDTIMISKDDKCVFAIENDKAYQERTAPGEPPSHSS